MRKIRLLPIISCIVFLSFTENAKSKESKNTQQKPKSDRDKISYFIGQQVGRNIKGLEVNLEVFSNSLRSVIEGKKSLLTEEELRDASVLLQGNIQAKAQQISAENLKKGNAYLAKNKKKKGVMTTESGLQYEILAEGKGKSPSNTSTVKVHYRGTHLDGTVFDSSYKRNQPAEFPVNGVIPGWTEALKLMKEKSKWRLHIPASLAYGPKSRPGIPGNSVLIFEVELLEVTNKENKKG